MLLFDDLGERHLDILLTRPQELLLPRDELVMDLLHLPAFFVGLLARDAQALRGGCLRCRSSESERAKKSSQSSQK